MRQRDTERKAPSSMVQNRQRRGPGLEHGRKAQESNTDQAREDSQSLQDAMLCDGLAGQRTSIRSSSQQQQQQQQQQPRRHQQCSVDALKSNRQSVPRCSTFNVKNIVQSIRYSIVLYFSLRGLHKCTILPEDQNPAIQEGNSSDR